MRSDGPSRPPPQCPRWRAYEAMGFGREAGTIGISPSSEWRAVLSPREGRFDVRREFLGFALFAPFPPLSEIVQYVAVKAFETLADVFVAVLAALLQEDHLIDAGVGKAVHVRPEFVRRADAG